MSHSHMLSMSGADRKVGNSNAAKSLTVHVSLV